MKVQFGMTLSPPCIIRKLLFAVNMCMHNSSRRDLQKWTPTCTCIVSVPFSTKKEKMQGSFLSKLNNLDHCLD